ncbi:hypothetical protein ACWPKO_25150 (plasmid) [Coraliomargarita sp. W4R53]
MIEQQPKMQWSRRAAPAKAELRRTNIKLRRGVYADSGWWASLKQFEKYRERVRAASIGLKNPTFALESAAVLHALPVFGEPHIHLYCASARHGYTRGDLRVHASESPREIVQVGGVNATSLLDTTVDLIRVLPLALAVAVLDAALARGIRADAVQDRLDSQANRRGIRNAHAALELADSRSESTLESISRVVIRYLGYTLPELQVEFTLDSSIARVDFFWRDVQVVGEADGEIKYAGDDSSASEALRKERRREIALLRQVRRVARWDWSDAWRPQKLDAILASAGVPRIGPADPDIDRMLRNARTRTKAAALKSAGV